MFSFPRLAAAVLITASMSAQAFVRHDEGIGFYVGFDNRAVFPSGGYAGLPNPNHNRLSLLFDHGDHFHGIGTYSFVGPAPHPGVLDTNSNNRIPETYTGDPPLSLTAGSGLYAGRMRSSVGASEYSHLGIASIQTLSSFAPGTDENILFTSSGNRWSGSLTGVNVGLQLLNATPGLKIGTEAVLDLFALSSTILLGHGNTFEFKPVFSVAAAALPGTYTAEFKLVNLNPASPYGDSGRFYFDFAVAAPVPEPSAYLMMLAGLIFMGTVAARRRRM
ncbi:MAG: PEP-CTERM sorting domain-containing protein [Burkholderiales bacterium]|nr:PEP-CTERM sorting domain-containing protein [Burkholderiales bacterium]